MLLFYNKFKTSKCNYSLKYRRLSFIYSIILTVDPLLCHIYFQSMQYSKIDFVICKNNLQIEYKLIRTWTCLG